MPKSIQARAVIFSVLLGVAFLLGRSLRNQNSADGDQALNPYTSIELLQIDEWPLPGVSEASAIAFDPIGNLYVLDEENAEVYAFDTNRELRFTFGRPGQGPGEFNAPQSIAVSQDHIAVIDQFGLINFYSLEGDFQNAIRIKGLRNNSHAQFLDDQHLLVSGYLPNAGPGANSGTLLHLVHTENEHVRHFFPLSSIAVQYNAYGFSGASFDIMAANRVVAIQPFSYSIAKYRDAFRDSSFFEVKALRYRPLNEEEDWENLQKWLGHWDMLDNIIAINDSLILVTMAKNQYSEATNILAIETIMELVHLGREVPLQSFGWEPKILAYDRNTGILYCEHKEEDTSEMRSFIRLYQVTLN